METIFTQDDLRYLQSLPLAMKVQKSQAKILEWCKQWMRKIETVLKPTGTFWLEIGDEYAAELKVLATKEIGFVCRQWVIWYYTFGVNCETKFTRSHAHLLHFVKDAKSFTFNGSEIRVPSARQLIYNDKRGNPKGRLPDDTWILMPQFLPAGHMTDDSLLMQPRVCGTFKERQGWHPCQMPKPILERLIKVSSNPGEKVLDPFFGSGTTGAVAKRLGRHWMGFEISAAYVEKATERINCGGETGS